VSLLCAPYRVTSSVPVEIFRDFISALQGGPIAVTIENIHGLSLLSSEFGFGGLSLQFPRPPASSGRSALMNRIAGLEADLRQSLDRIAFLESANPAASPAFLADLSRVECAIGSLSSRVLFLSESLLAPLSSLDRAVGRIDPLVFGEGRLRNIFSEIRREIARLRVDFSSVPAWKAAGYSPMQLNSLILPWLPTFFIPLLSPKKTPRVILIGESNVGKSTLVERLRTKQFISCSGRTNGASHSHLAGMYLWDTAGNSAFRPLVHMYLNGANGVMLFFSLEDRSSFLELDFWLSIISKVSLEVPVLLVGTKADLSLERAVSGEEARGFAADHELPYVEASARTGMGVEEAFDKMTEVIANTRTLPLWRGSRDGFGAQDFHRCCDGKSPTLTLIRDTEGNIFGGFSAIPWKSAVMERSLPDSGLQSFLFTVKNPHDLAGRIFRLKSPKSASAIGVSARLGPSFGDEDLVICDHCDVNASHARSFGSSYLNDSNIPGPLFTQYETFKVSEIEVFGINLQ
jgi:small GTP-binding protein